MTMLEPQYKAAPHDSVFAATGGASKIAPLTSIRFVAALWVVMHHTFPVAPEDAVDATVLDGLLHRGFTAVGLFFVLSGFILASIYQTLPDRRSIHRFWIARFARIYPVYILSLLVDVPRLLTWRIAKYGLASGVAATFATLGVQSAMMQTWLPLSTLQGLNSPSWSVSTAVFFYLAFPFLIGPIASIRSGLRLASLLALSWGAAMIVPVMLSAGADDLPANIETALHQNPLLRLPEFVAGIIAANLYRHHWSNSPREAQRRVVKFCLIVTLACMIALAAFVDQFHFLTLHSRLLLMPVYCSFVVAVAMSSGAAHALLSLPSFVLLGEASYSFYLLHGPLRTLLLSIGFAPNMFHWGVYILILIGLSLFLHFYVERPLRSRIMKRYDTWARRSRKPQIGL